MSDQTGGPVNPPPRKAAGTTKKAAARPPRNPRTQPDPAIAELLDRSRVIEGRVNNHGVQIDAISVEVDAQGGRITDLTGVVDAQGARQDGFDADLAALLAAGDANARALGVLEPEVAGLRTDVNALGGRLDTFDGRLNGLLQAGTDARRDIDALTGRVRTIDSDLTDVEQRVSTLEKLTATPVIPLLVILFIGFIAWFRGSAMGAKVAGSKPATDGLSFTDAQAKLAQWHSTVSRDEFIGGLAYFAITVGILLVLWMLVHWAINRRPQSEEPEQNNAPATGSAPSGPAPAVPAPTTATPARPGLWTRFRNYLRPDPAVPPAGPPAQHQAPQAPASAAAPGLPNAQP